MSTQTNQQADRIPFEINTQSNMPIRPLEQMRGKDWIAYFQYKHGQESASQVRNALLVVMALVVAVTFQAVGNPPDGVSQPKANPPGGVSQPKDLHCVLFFSGNTVAFILSVGVISILVYGFPFCKEIWVALFALSIAYLIAFLSSNSLHTKCGQLSLVAFFLPVFVSSGLRVMLDKL